MREFIAFLKPVARGATTSSKPSPCLPDEPEILATSAGVEFVRTPDACFDWS